MSKINIFSLLLLMVLLNEEVLLARVFRMNNETVATYFGGTYGPSLLKQTHFSGTSGTGATIDKSVLINYSGEFGLLFRGSKLGLRFGMEAIKPTTLTKAIGSDSGGVKLYDFESNISALIPKITLEFNLKSSDSWRTFLALGGGAATAIYKNSYTLTTDGQTTFPGVADFSDEATGTALLYDGALCFETLMNDTTTIAFSVGYRKLEVTGYKYKADVLNLSGNHLKGDPVLNDDGTAKTSLYNGAMASILFRFYLGK
jgi:hypothetical protein